MLFKTLLLNILNAGVDEEFQFAEKRNLRILNGIALILIAISIIFMLLLLKETDIQDIKINFIVNINVFLLGFFVLWFNKKRKYDIASLLLFIGSIAFLVGMPFYRESYSGLNIYLFVLVVAGVLFFDTQIIRILFVCIAGISLIGSTYMATAPEWRDEFEFNEVNFFINAVIALIMLYFMVFSFKNESQKYQKQVEKNNKVIQNQNKKLNTKNQYIQSSIDYAMRIQRAILPDITDLKEFFMLYQPKDVVSGDFYWVHQAEQKAWIVVGDCTGHGVPGAMLSMLSISLLDKIKSDTNIQTPASMLEMLDREIQTTLKQEKGSNQDGLDVSLCLIDFKNQTLTFSGARNPLYIITPSEPQKIHELKATRRSIGGKSHKKVKPFENYTYQYDEATCLYMSSDGYKDQFGGPNNKKIGAKGFKKMLLAMQEQSMPEQESYLTKHIEQWRKEGNEAQIDDICVFGCQL